MRFRNLEKYQTGKTGSTLQLAIPLPKTPDGRVYRYSPNETPIRATSFWASAWRGLYCPRR
jgi:hypothetical protein